MGNSTSVSDRSANNIPAELVEELIAQVERQVDHLRCKPLRLDESHGLSYERMKVRKLKELLMQVYTLYPELLKGEADHDVAPIKLPLELMEDVRQECKISLPATKNCTDDELEEMQRLTKFLKQLDRFHQPLRPWEGDWILEPEQVTLEFLSKLLGADVRDFVVKEAYQDQQPVKHCPCRYFAIRVLFKNKDDEMKKPSRLMLHVPSVAFLDENDSVTVSSIFRKKVVFYRDLYQEIPLHCPGLVGVWDDGSATNMRRFLIVTRDICTRFFPRDKKENGESSTYNQNAFKTTINNNNFLNKSAAANVPVSADCNQFASSTLDIRRVLDELAHFHGHFFYHTIVVGVCTSQTMFVWNDVCDEKEVVVQIFFKLLLLYKLL